MKEIKNAREPVWLSGGVAAGSCPTSWLNLATPRPALRANNEPSRPDKFAAVSLAPCPQHHDVRGKFWHENDLVQLFAVVRVDG